MRTLLDAALFSVLAIAMGCGGSSELPSNQTGGAYFSSPGTPRFEVLATSSWEGQQSGISLRVSLPNSSLVFLLEGGRYQAVYEIIARLYDEEGERVLKEMVWPETTSVVRYEVTQVPQPVVHSYFIPSSEGRFILRISVRDDNSGKSGTLEQPVHIPPFHTNQPSIVSATLEVLRSGEEAFVPVVPPLVGRDYDSLRISCVIHSPAEHHHQTLKTLVRSFPGDTSIASAPYLFSPIQGSFPVAGVDFRSPDTVAIVGQTVASASGRTTVDLPLPHLLEGFYRFTTTLTSHSSVSGDTTITQTLDASVFEPGFPTPRTLDELVDPLVYIAGRNELDTLREVSDPVEKKKRFDAFWLAEGAKPQAAANAIKQYYTRVEEANRFFSTHKEGWRTDRGMIYIVLGPPVAVSHILQKEVWFYSKAEQDPVNTFVFVQAQMRVESPLLHNYILNRQSYYESTWQRAIERWRRATVF